MARGRVQRDVPSEDEVDAFHSQREKILIGDAPVLRRGGRQVADESFDEPILDLPDSDEDGADGLGSTDEDDDESWGRTKKTFYSADGDAEDLEDEAREARRMQKRSLALLSERHFLGNAERAASSSASESATSARVVELDSSDDEEEANASDRYATEADLEGLDGAAVVRLLPPQEALRVLEEMAPETRDFVREFKRRAIEIRETVEPVLASMRAASSAASPPQEGEAGLAFLQAKNQLLVGYCANLAYYLLLKVQGRSIKDHPVVERLIKYRLLIEKIKPMEAKLQYQIEKYVSVSLLSGASGASKDIDEAALSFKPNLALLDGDNDDDSQSEGENAPYRAPKVAPTHFASSSSSSARTEAAREEERARVLASKSRLLADMQEDFDDRPIEESVDPVYGRSSGPSASAHRREKYEEDNFVRVTLTAKERRKLEAATAKPIDELDDLNDFFRTTTKDKKASSAAGKSAVDRLLGTRTPRPAEARGGSEAAAGGAKQAKRKAESSGDEMSEIEDDMTPNFKPSRASDAGKRKQAPPSREGGGGPAPYRHIIRDTEPRAPRPASYEMMKNKGLTPKRPKEVRNPRVRQRQKWERAQKKIGSTKAIVRTSAKPYSGESSGIRTNLSRSAKF